MNLMDITPVTMIINEEYWIYHVMRQALRYFGNMIVLDTGSTDKTLEIIDDVVADVGHSPVIIEENYIEGHQIGNGRNVLRNLVKTEWMFLIDGDEVWDERNMFNLVTHLHHVEVPDHVNVIMLGGKNIADDDGILKVREMASYDRMFRKGIVWSRTDYPFESYGLNDTVKSDQLMYVPHDNAHFWHVRHTQRSSIDNETFFRTRKKDYYEFKGVYEELPKDWLFPIVRPYDNHYLIELRAKRNGK